MDTDYNRPRRPNADTITYLKSLPFNESFAHEEISSYLHYQKSLQQNQQQDIPIQETEYPQNLSAAISALSSIQNEIASLAGDENASSTIETITRITVPYSTLCTRKLLFGIQDYIVHLSTHRYGSHVVQTILQSIHLSKSQQQQGDVGEEEFNETEICQILEIDTEEELNDDENKDLPSLPQLLFNITNEILPATKQLAVHICGSHVLRSLLCALSGVVEEIPSHLAHKGIAGGFDGGNGNKRGKAKKKKKKKKSNESENDGITNSASYAKYKLLSTTTDNSEGTTSTSRVDIINDTTIKESFHNLLWELTGIDFQNIDTAASTSQKVGDLQQFVCHPSAGPLLIVLLRILTLRSSSSSSSPSNMTTTTKTTTNIKEDSQVLAHDNSQPTKEEKSITDFRLGIIESQPYFHPNSHAEILAKTIICWNDDDDNNTNTTEQTQCGETIYGLSGEIRGSHMLETLLRSSNDEFYQKICDAGKFFDHDSFVEYVQHDVSNFVIQTLLNTARTRKQADALVKCVEGLISSNGYILKNENKRKGILWRTIEMSAKFRIGQETLLKSIRKGYTYLHKNDEGIRSLSVVDDEQILSSPYSLMEIADCIPLLIGYKEAQGDKGRIGLDAIGTRTTYYLLRFVPRLCTDVIRGILSHYSTKQIISICNDGLGSRW